MIFRQFALLTLLFAMTLNLNFADAVLVPRKVLVGPQFQSETATEISHSAIELFFSYSAIDTPSTSSSSIAKWNFQTSESPVISRSTRLLCPRCNRRVNAVLALDSRRVLVFFFDRVAVLNSTSLNALTVYSTSFWTEGDPVTAAKRTGRPNEYLAFSDINNGPSPSGKRIWLCTLGVGCTLVYEALPESNYNYLSFSHFDPDTREVYVLENSRRILRINIDSKALTGSFQPVDGSILGASYDNRKRALAMFSKFTDGSAAIHFLNLPAMALSPPVPVPSPAPFLIIDIFPQPSQGRVLYFPFPALPGLTFMVYDYVRSSFYSCGPWDPNGPIVRYLTVVGDRVFAGSTSIGLTTGSYLYEVFPDQCIPGGAPTPKPTRSPPTKRPSTPTKRPSTPTKKPSTPTKKPFTASRRPVTVTKKPLRHL
mmetsp:Transcript_38096/g.61691  ORF Transcript_38096/g.61691 Transcript_38096/m.61691 type:complete len:425 (+) Transcript_38096:238-1512(+)